MPIDGVVKQMDYIPQQSGIVFECSVASKCKQDPENMARTSMSQKKKCLLSVDHGARCVAYPEETSAWLIDVDTNRIKPVK